MNSHCWICGSDKFSMLRVSATTACGEELDAIVLLCSCGLPRDQLIPLVAGMGMLRPAEGEA